MKIYFDDGSFISLDETNTQDKVLNITMCGLKEDRKSLTMSASELDKEQVSRMCDFLQNILKKFS